MIFIIMNVRFIISVFVAGFNAVPIDLLNIECKKPNQWNEYKKLEKSKQMNKVYKGKNNHSGIIKKIRKQ